MLLAGGHPTPDEINRCIREIGDPVACASRPWPSWPWLDTTIAVLAVVVLVVCVAGALYSAFDNHRKKRRTQIGRAR